MNKASTTSASFATRGEIKRIDSVKMMQLIALLAWLLSIIFLIVFLSRLEDPTHIISVFGLILGSGAPFLVILELIKKLKEERRNAKAESGKRGILLAKIARKENKFLPSKFEEDFIESIASSVDKASRLIVKHELERYNDYLGISEKTAQSIEELGKEKNIKRIIPLVKGACDQVIGDLRIHNESDYFRLRLDNKEIRQGFYKDIFLYITVWLKNSIKYDLAMPAIEDRVVNDRLLYIGVFKILREEKSHELGSDSLHSGEIISKYLGLLINQFGG